MADGFSVGDSIRTVLDNGEVDPTIYIVLSVGPELLTCTVNGVKKTVRRDKSVKINKPRK